MKRFLSIVVITALLIPSQGCATLKNTKIPKAFDDVGVCKQCKKMVALDGLTDDDIAICPECGGRFVVKDARTGFIRKIVERRNRKTAESFLTVMWLATSVAGTLYGIPIPPPPLSEHSFAPYKPPFKIRCRRARSIYKNFYLSSQFPNPYAMERGAYSIVINDFHDYDGPNLDLNRITLRKIGESNYDFIDNRSMLEMKN